MSVEDRGDGQQAIIQPTEAERAYSVKLFHPIHPGIPCPNNGVSERLVVQAVNKAQLRVKVESEEHVHFRGDVCKKCGALAKVSLD